jgi:hypothetical protein
MHQGTIFVVKSFNMFEQSKRRSLNEFKIFVLMLKLVNNLLFLFLEYFTNQQDA